MLAAFLVGCARLPLAPHVRPATCLSALRCAPRRHAVMSAVSKKIATHNGTFHCDEVLAVHMLRRTASYRDAPVVRSRDEAVLATADVVVDVGGVYSPEIHRYDHHQREFAHTFDTEGPRARTKLSSAGLVYKHFGREVVSSVLAKKNVVLGEKDLETVYLKTYDAFVEAVDAVDNGISQYITDQPPRYDSGTSLGSRVGRLNAEWNEPNSPEIQDENFEKAVVIAGAEFDDCVERIAKSWLPARAIVLRAMNARQSDDDLGRILVLREWAPWKDHLFTIEAEETASGSSRPVQYVVYKDMTGGSWRLQAVPANKGSFESRTPLPDAWRGLRNEALSNLAGIDNCIFVHASGFIGGNQTFEGALEMARKALVIAEKKNN
jgi:uncharacterized UPF0160 family protein